MQGYDVMEEMYNEKTAAMNFVTELCQSRTKGNLEAFMGLCVNVMNEYQVHTLLDYPYSMPDMHWFRLPASLPISLMS